MKNILHSILSKIDLHVYVVIANDNGKFSKCKVFFKKNRAFDYHQGLIAIYGIGNASSFSCYIL